MAILSRGQHQSRRICSHIRLTQVSWSIGSKEVRRDFAAEAHAHPPAVNKPLLVAVRREQITKLAFFQKPTPEPELPEKEHGTPLLLAL